MPKKCNMITVHHEETREKVPHERSATHKKVHYYNVTPRKLQLEKSSTWKKCNIEKVQLGKCTTQKTCNMKRVHKRYNIKTVQHEKRCDMKRVQNGKGATTNEYNTKKVLLKISAKWKMCNTEKCNTKSARHKKVKLEKSVIWKKCNTKWVQHKEGATWSNARKGTTSEAYNTRYNT